jgi:hypothetical protein
MLLDSNLKRAIELEEKYGKNSMFSEILNKINVGPSVGGYEVPGDIAMGVGFSKSKPIVNHEIQHALQRSRTLAIDDELKALEAKNNDILSEDELGALDYFQTGSKGKESSAFLAEARTAMKEAGLIKNDYDEISPELVKEAMEYFKKNPQKILLKEKNSFPFRELSQTRIFDIHAPTDFNYNLLSKSFNKLPAILPIGLGLGAASQLNNEETPQYKQGGIIKDDRGQWDHPGEITQIDSPYITMKGVPYPVLGVSNTGDVQMMYPEQEYEFDGDSVIEYPMARNGINNLDARPLVKLDQLTNFTNYNKPQPGSRWLSKYE